MGKPLIYAEARSGVSHRVVSVDTLVQDRHPFKGRRWNSGIVDDAMSIHIFFLSLGNVMLFRRCELVKAKVE